MGMQKVQISQVPFRILDVAYIIEGLIENMLLSSISHFLFYHSDNQSQVLDVHYEASSTVLLSYIDHDHNYQKDLRMNHWV